LWVRIESTQKPDTHGGALLTSLSTSVQQYRALYSQGRELAKYLMDHVKLDKIATIYSSSFAPEVLVRDGGISSLPACHLYSYRGKRDFLLLAGDSSPMDDQYPFTRLILDYAKECNVNEVYSIGARWTENPVSEFQEPELNGFATDSAGVSELEKMGVKPIKGEPAPFFSSLIVSMAPDWGMRGFKLSVDHGEPSPHPRTTLKMLGLLSARLGFEVNLEDLKSLVKAAPAEKTVDRDAIYT